MKTVKIIHIRTIIITSDSQELCIRLSQYMPCV